VTILKNSNTKESAQHEFPQIDENLDQYFEQIEDDLFNRKERLQQLEDGMIPQTDTILSAIFQEIKKQSDKARKRSTKNSRIHFFKAKSSLPVSISIVSQAGKMENSRDRVWLMRLSNSRLLRNSTTAQGLTWACHKDSIRYLHPSSTRFPIW
jgi:hypothetical protein